MRGRNEGPKYGTSDPELWVYEGQGNFGTVQKTKAAMNSLDPVWTETICVRLGELDRPRTTGNATARRSPLLLGTPRADFRTCFDIRDDFDPAVGDPTGGHSPLLHFGCVMLTQSWDDRQQAVQLNGGVTLYFKQVVASLAPPPSPPSLPSPPSPPPSLDVATVLNVRFRNGGPTGDLASAGVLVHRTSARTRTAAVWHLQLNDCAHFFLFFPCTVAEFDAMDDPDPDGEPWIPGRGRWDTGDRISASLVYYRMVPDPGYNIPIYSFDLAGLILSPTRNRLLCAYPFDVGSLSRICHPRGVSASCVPGCTPYLYHSTWCDLNNDEWPCAHRPSALAAVMERRDEISFSAKKPDEKMWDDNKFCEIARSRPFKPSRPTLTMGTDAEQRSCDLSRVSSRR